MKWLADENSDNNIVRSLRRRSVGFDIVRAQDLDEIAGTDDITLLIWSSRNDRVILTHDLSTMVPAAQSLADTVRKPRILFVRDSLPIGAAVEDILLVDECSIDSDWAAGVLYLPLR